MEPRLAHMTQDGVLSAIEQEKIVLIPTGATEAHGPHMPTDTDSHQAEHIAVELAKRIDGVVAPTICYGISKTFEHFPGTISLSIPLYQDLVYEVGRALIKQGFKHVILLNGNRPNGTSNDAVARRLVDDLDDEYDFMATAVSYWEPGAAKIHAMRKSGIGGMGHGGEFETSFQLATRPHLVKMDNLEGLATTPVKWDLVAPMEPVRTYARRPRPAKGHPAIFGIPHDASIESGQDFIDSTVGALVEMVKNIQPSYESLK